MDHLVSVNVTGKGCIDWLIYRLVSSHRRHLVTAARLHMAAKEFQFSQTFKQ